ncbi:branched-chain amino acid ABC transporter permease [Halobacterium wangiae]|uniref:branched-chain amino acid ABC transporter permease n=1 Tax=Halobacterium wangiae TaxID=2902623 RepID=UPI001E2D1AE2|nr:branched-chain amino acid ABC transporter permease [Halobacterium wangiae]
MALLSGWAAFIVTIATIGCIYGLLTLGLNVHYGYTGLLNFGHVAFFAAGAYASAIVTMPPPSTVTNASYAIWLDLPMPWGFPVSLAAASLVGGALALLIGLTSVRLGTHYLAIATFALAGVFSDVLVNEAWLTNGSFGMNSVPKPGQAALGPDAWQLAYLAFAVLSLVAVYLLVERVLDAPFGRLLKGVRESEAAAEMLGKNTTVVKLKSFVIGGMIAGFAGGVYAHYLGSVVTAQFVPHVTFTVWAAMLLGGAASNTGAVAGAVLVVAFEESTRFITTAYNWVQGTLPDPLTSVLPALVGPLPDNPSFIPSMRFVVIGLLFVLVIRYRPEGLFGDPSEIEALGEEE